MPLAISHRNRVKPSKALSRATADRRTMKNWHTLRRNIHNRNRLLQEIFSKHFSKNPPKMRPEIVLIFANDFAICLQNFSL